METRLLIKFKMRENQPERMERKTKREQERKQERKRKYDDARKCTETGS